MHERRAHHTFLSVCVLLGVPCRGIATTEVVDVDRLSPTSVRTPVTGSPCRC
jgi:hypothetical protein